MYESHSHPHDYMGLEAQSRSGKFCVSSSRVYRGETVGELKVDFLYRRRSGRGSYHHWFQLL